MLAPSAEQTQSAPFWRRAPALTAALVVAVGGGAAIAGAWFFQLVIGLAPCHLCLGQRVPYYIAIPLALIVAATAWRKAPRGLVIGGLVALALLMAWGAYLGVFHAGVEWKLWTGPTDCTGAAELGPGADFMKRLQGGINLQRCDEAAWRFLGISLAGYNALIASALTLVALCGARETARR
jgi:disulfide bond formation protein DsbB